MINDNTILSSFDDKPTLLEWLKKVEDALKSDTATAVSVENPNANTYVFKITFADGTTLSSGNVVFPDSVKDVSIKEGHIIVTQISGTQTDLGAINPYAGTIVLNAQTNDVDINGETKINAGLEVLNEINCDNIVAKGAIQTDSDLAVTGNAQVNGRLQVNSSIISNGEIRGGNISGTKFLLGTEEMPLVKANPTGEATKTLEKIKIGNVAYNVGGGTENDRVLTLIAPYPRSEESVYKSVPIDNDDIWNKITNFYYETIKIYYNDGNPLGVFNVLFHYYSDFKEKYYACFTDTKGNISYSEWYGRSFSKTRGLRLSFNANNKSVNLTDFGNFNQWSFDKSKFDALYKLADKPTQDGNYILKASVSGGAVTYTWELQQ